MGYEQERPKEFSPELLRAFRAVFVNRSDAYPFQQPTGSYIAVKKPLTDHLLVGHLKGLVTIGSYALSADSMAQWVCFDGDTPEQWEQLGAVAVALARQRVPVYRELSRRGGHVWLFFERPVPGLHVYRFARQLLRENGIDVDTTSAKPIEIYPRQAQLAVEGLGSQVRLPLGVHRKTGKVYPFVDSADRPLAQTPRELLPLLAAPKRVTLPFVLSVVSRAPQARVPTPTPAFQVKHSPDLAQLRPSERIKAAISTVSFVRQYVEVDERGHGSCPFHDDEHHSFSVVEQGDYWNCFAGCGGGDLIHFWSKWRSEHGEDGSFTETIRDLLRILQL